MTGTKETPPHMVRGSRVLPRPVERAINAALSRGPGYEPTPIGPAFDDTSISGYYVDFRAKTTGSVAGESSELPAIQQIQLGLGWWERHVAGDRQARSRFLDLCDGIERRAVRTDSCVRWPMNVPVPKYRLSPGWSSALAQGQAGSLFVRAHLLTGEDRYADLARGAIEPFVSGRPSELVTSTAVGPVLEEAPTSPPSHILNGWMSALWGLWDVQLGLHDARARAAFESGLRSLRTLLPQYDTGWWSLYSLYPHALQDLAKPIYHRFHITQLEVFQRLTGHADIAAIRTRWASYDRPDKRLLAITQKGAFAIADSKRRRQWERSA